jgi:hypothetical protein
MRFTRQIRVGALSCHARDEFVHLIQYEVQFQRSGAKDRNFDSSPHGPGGREFCSDRTLRAQVRAPLPNGESAPLHSIFGHDAGNGSPSFRHESSSCSGHESGDSVAFVSVELRHRGTSQRFEKGYSSGDCSREQPYGTGYFDRVFDTRSRSRVEFR